MPKQITEIKTVYKYTVTVCGESYYSDRFGNGGHSTWISSKDVDTLKEVRKFLVSHKAKKNKLSVTIYNNWTKERYPKPKEQGEPWVVNLNI